MEASKNAPLVSVIVPVYNGERTIGPCLKSLMEQDYPKDRYEVIVVDNRSQDGTADLVRKFPVRLLEEPRLQSSYAARNTGVRNAKGEILAFTDADCSVSRNWLTEGVEGFRGGDVAGVAGKIAVQEPKNEIERYLEIKQPVKHSSAASNGFLPYAITANVFYRKWLFAKIGFFEEWESAGDADYSWRVQLNTPFKIHFAPGAVVYHKHRSTLKSMFKQYIKFGYGKACLLRKYGNHLKKRPKPVVIRVRQLHKDRKFRLFDAIASVGWRAGRMLGALHGRGLC